MITLKTSPIWGPFLGLILLALPTCGGGGGGGGGSSTPGPDLVSTAFYGSSGSDTQPDTGERVRLSFDLPIQIQGGTTFTDASALLSGAGSLGTGDLTLTRINPYTIDVYLGAGTSFTPGSTTLALANTQNTIAGTTGQPATTTGPKTIQTGTPECSQLTVAGIPTALNGDGPAGGTLLIPSQGFPLDLTWADRDGGTINSAALYLGASVAVTTNNGVIPAGENLIPYFNTSNLTATGVRLTAGSSMVVPTGSCIFWATIQDDQAKVSPRVAREFLAVEADDDLTPFETTVNPEQVWLIDIARDRQTIAISGTTTITITVTNSGNGQADFQEDLITFGLRTNSPGFTDLGDGTHPNDFLQAKVQAAILTNLRTILAGIPVSFTYTAPAAFPSSLAVPYAQASFSRISLGGSSEVSALGLAFYDERNLHQVDNTAWPGSTPSYAVSLGVFSLELVIFSVNRVSTTSFRQVFDPLIPGRGTPAGEGANDLEVLRYLAGLQGSTSYAGRAADIEDAYLALGRFLAVVVAHETGHSVGLVGDGAQPLGLHGNNPTAFTGSDSNHLDLSSTTIFPSSAQAIMAPAIYFSKSLDPNTAFNPLNQAWLKGQVFYLGTLTGKVPGW